MGPNLSPEAATPREEGDDPAGEEHHHHDEEQPVDHQVGVLEVGLEISEVRVRTMHAEDRPPHRRRPPEHGDQRRLDGDLEGEHGVRPDEAEVARVDAPGERGQHRAGEQGQQLVHRRDSRPPPSRCSRSPGWPGAGSRSASCGSRSSQGEGRPRAAGSPAEELGVQVRGLEEERGVGPHRTVGELVLVLHQHPDDLRRGDGGQGEVRTRGGGR